jgi:uncharacterized membrane protein YphA (DoxX/SURF4 family)
MPTAVTPPGFRCPRNYPGFLGAFFLVVLRIAIGWHFLTEGLDKVESTQYGNQPFSAEVYLRNATGPLAPYFRGMLPDVNGLALLDPTRLKAGWGDTVERIEKQFGFDQDQREKARKLLEESYVWADYWFNNFDNREAREKYIDELAKVQKTEADPNALAFELERAWESRRTLDGDRRKLTAPLVARGQELQDAVVAVATPEQKSTLATRYSFPWLENRLPSRMQTSIEGWRARSAEYTPPWTFLDVANVLTMYGLCAIGVCLMLGFLTPFAALCAAAFLAMIYLSMPPWPGLPPNPKAEGHYWIVSKNLVELIACLLIATTASGHWFGLDALVFGARRRRRWARYEERLAARQGRRQAGNGEPAEPESRPTVKITTRK